MESAPSWARRATPGTPSSAGAPVSPRVASTSSRCWTTLRPARPSSSGCSWRSSGWPGSTVRTELSSGGWCAPTAKTQPLCRHCDRQGRRPWALSLCCFLFGKAALLCGHHTSQRRLGSQLFHGSVRTAWTAARNPYCGQSTRCGHIITLLVLEEEGFARTLGHWLVLEARSPHRGGRGTG